MASKPKLSVGIVSLGCAKNLVDTQIMVGKLLNDNVELSGGVENADIILVNTCSFIDAARDESIDTILEMCEYKRIGKCRAVVVTGCMPQRYKETLKESMPEVDAFIGVDELDSIAEIVDRLAGGESGVLAVSDKSTRLFEPEAKPVVLTGGPFAYIKVAEGCNHRCAFCAIPSIRGDHRSRTVDSIVKEAENLLSMGCRELNLISQDVTAYGSDLDGVNLSALLKALGRLGDGFWIRLLYGYPSNVTQELLETMGEVSQVVPYLDVPVQHADPDVLKRMTRAGTLPYIENMIAQSRRILPDIVMRTTCLVGFPGETRREFDNLYRFVKETEFDHLGVFAYSPEEGTPAFTMDNVPERRTALKRQEKLMLLQQEIVEKKGESLLGKETLCLIEEQVEGEEGVWTGRTARQAPEVDGITLVEGVDESVSAGDFVKVRYSESVEYDLIADAL